ncbi:hypothetical protein B0T20DRAFT_496677 [Sordaria brevicollis]|uniref:Uncharacterized protein n=1 Tax=Sordaria brevicollis TaxID=83679 RepID=A0AAE0PHW1_SORBR|nr:hypothetical protein B0T20DRAFT_496677 [Sordaria brevicollis]
MEANRHSSGGATSLCPELEGEDPYLPNLWICGANLTDDQELVMEYLIAHLNHPRVVSVQAAADAIHKLLPVKNIPENNKSSNATTRPSASTGMQPDNSAAKMMCEFWCLFFDIAKNIPSWHAAQARLQQLIKKLVDLYEAGAEIEKKEWMSRERDGLGTKECFMASAAEWMKYAAHLLWQQALDWDNPTSDKSGNKSSFVWDCGSPTGVMYGGEPGLHMDRWMHWYATFRKIIKNCSMLEEAKLVVHFAQVSVTAMDRVMGVPASGTVGTKQPVQFKGKVTNYLSGEDLIIESISDLCQCDSRKSDLSNVGGMAEGSPGLTLPPAVYKEGAVASETASGDRKKAKAEAKAAARGKLTIKSSAFM